MFNNLEAEQARHNMTNGQVANVIGISRVSYERKKKSGKFNRAEIVILLKLLIAISITCLPLMKNQHSTNHAQNKLYRGDNYGEIKAAQRNCNGSDRSERRASPVAGTLRGRCNVPRPR